MNEIGRHRRAYGASRRRSAAASGWSASLSCASTLIEKSGSDAMRMSDVAEMAGISIGSLYQYFPDKGAIIRTLAERYNVARPALYRGGSAGCAGQGRACGGRSAS